MSLSIGLALFRSMPFFPFSVFEIRECLGRPRPSGGLCLCLLLVIFGTFLTLGPIREDQNGEFPLPGIGLGSSSGAFLSSPVDRHRHPERALPCLKHHVSGQSLTCPGQAEPLASFPGVPLDLAAGNSSIDWQSPPNARPTSPAPPESSEAVFTPFDPPPRASSVRTKGARRPDFPYFLRRTR